MKYDTMKNNTRKKKRTFTSILRIREKAVHYAWRFNAEFLLCDKSPRLSENGAI